MHTANGKVNFVRVFVIQKCLVYRKYRYRWRSLNNTKN